jgi:hypothetical protein
VQRTRRWHCQCAFVLASILEKKRMQTNSTKNQQSWNICVQLHCIFHDLLMRKKDMVNMPEYSSSLLMLVPTTGKIRLAKN